MSIRTLLLVLLVGTLLPATSLAQPNGLSLPKAPGAQEEARPGPGLGGDSVFPPGYKGVVWAATPEIVQGLRGRVMESVPNPNPHITYLIDAPRPGEIDNKEVVRWKFWDGLLTEVHVIYEGPFTGKEGRDLVAKFERRYGEGKYDATLGPTSPNHPRPTVIEEWWTWEDPFTIQILKREKEDESWTVIRHSTVLQAGRRAQEERELERDRTRRVKDIELD